ncbi:hypothetical protein AAE02nite_48620 [Adhaeribacter aerolatus]|uniref:GIY-YIG domain-containing protein n=1 Tax=Adhaeribacter aerolatus TaxID=670289 RepID=A0A512B5E3_9BACT|nr:GIY-YIG nuclease family protein [Adhaeribacter aerolatus]GEO07198.1 hypothetical protein AAE02nite_48620 [Adhaeribacter aerolatus]
MESEFKNIGFDKYFYAKGIRSIAGQFSQNNRCGIYILHFENGEYYVGLAIDVVNRYAQHRQNHLDIEFISFKEVAKSKLPEIERETVYELENRKKELRNINIVSIIIGETDLDLIVSKEEQGKWINYELPFESLTTKRFEYPEHRKRYTKKFEQLKSNPLFENCCDILQHYIYFTIPYPKKTEYSFWCCSCLPSTDNALIRVNIFWQETLNIFEEEFEYEENRIVKKEKGLSIAIWLSKSKLFETYTETELLEKYKTLSIGNVVYKSGGQDQQQLIIDDIEFLDFLYDRPISDAIKDFNLRLLRKGGCIFNRYHSFDLADEAVRTDNLIPE